ncbi:nuclear transport factor 2 family protein [Bradyrhizobium xenonodulans]|uniref:Nuclear transport factor 2 family protein n=1 Tax=Bradyrhizobium xenonodulans TaxID=2736875 RepID=A0ABY7MK86_9BRAD|nr:nuclear transport factor 2 family protein [Bradyrhizobium xenonodulans]WBL78808.1 nuclear transport factor 2 family protein [Bradyrhizobium xenonodulans]
MSFDPMAAAVDWLDSYRAGDIEAILEMYAEDAVMYCDCDELVITGREGLRSYWVARLQKYPAAELDNLQPARDGATISYICEENVVKADLAFNDAGKIKTLSCGPLPRASSCKIRS